MGTQLIGAIEAVCSEWSGDDNENNNNKYDYDDDYNNNDDNNDNGNSNDNYSDNDNDNDNNDSDDNDSDDNDDNFSEAVFVSPMPPMNNFKPSPDTDMVIIFEELLKPASISTMFISVKLFP